MERFIDQCRSQGLPQDKIDLLNAIKFNDQGMTAEEQGKIDEARSAYQNALGLSRFGGQRFRQDYLRSSARICKEPEHRGKEYCQ
jgi:hypothetical protein